MPAEIAQNQLHSKSCPFENCDFTSGQTSELRSHLQKHPDHEFCATCDEAFEDWDAFKKHKVISPKHISCPTCGIDYKSRSGLESHMKQSHRIDENLVCPGCDSVFKRVGAIISHLSGGYCQNALEPSRAITKGQFNDHITHQAIIFHYLHPQQSRSGNAVLFKGPLGPDESSDTNMPSNLMDDLVSAQSLPDTSHQSSEYKKEAMEEPILSTHAKDEQASLHRNDLLKASEKGENSSEQFSNMARKKFWDANDPTFDPENHFNWLHQRYECPIPGCDWNSKSPNSLFQHCLQTHPASRFHCPQCLRPFKSFVALTQHMESAVTRCKINCNEKYAFLMHQITGGFVEVDHLDGSGKVTYSAHRPQTFENQEEPEGSW